MSDNGQVRKDTDRSDEELVAELMAKAKAEGVDMVGENGLLSRYDCMTCATERPR